MVVNISLTQQEAAQDQSALRVGCGSLMLDRQGRILSCGAPVEKLFGVSHLQLMGRGIGEFIGELLPEGGGPGSDASHVGHLCADGEWRQFAAQDVGGRGFTAELKVLQMITCDPEIFLLYVRRLEDGSTAVSPSLPYPT